MNTSQIISHLTKKASSIEKANSFIASPGIYAFFFVGIKFPLKDYQPPKKQIIYLGKTQSSGVSRVLKTHFGTGKTGSSTVRRTLGALLRKELNLSPIPRNSSDLEKGILSYQFDQESERKLTKWMEKNLQVSFYPLADDDVARTESALINELAPVLNLEGNTGNLFGRYIQAQRKECAQIASKSITTESKRPTKRIARNKIGYEPYLNDVNNPDDKINAQIAGCVMRLIKIVFILIVILILIATCAT